MEGLSEELSCAPDSLVDLRTGAYDCDCESPNPTVAEIVVGGAWEWLDGFKGWCAGDEGSFSENWSFIHDDEETPEGAAQSYALYAVGVWMGIVTNIVLELVLVCRVHLLKGVPGGPSPRTLKVLRWAVGCQLVIVCVEINQCVGCCTRQFFTKSFLGDDVAVLARSSGEEPASPRHRAGVVSMAWRTTR